MFREGGNGNYTPTPCEKYIMRGYFSQGLPNFPTKLKYATYEFTEKLINPQKNMQYDHFIFLIQ